jgi:hypothetical protein
VHRIHDEIVERGIGARIDEEVNEANDQADGRGDGGVTPDAGGRCIESAIARAGVAGGAQVRLW